MSEHHEIIRVFVASPSGLEDERRAAWEIVEETNRRNGNHWRLQFQAIGWEDTVGGNRRAQDIINRDLETCDFFIGILADHWGTPPQVDSDSKTRYTSGFEEEYEIAQRLHSKGKMEDIFLFFKRISAERRRDPGASLQRILDFREKVQKNRKPLFVEFDEIEKFKTKVGDALVQIGWNRSAPNVRPEIVSPIAYKSMRVASPSDDGGTKDGYFLPEEPRDFLNMIRDKGRQANQLRNVDVARLRLVAIGMHQSGNDEYYMGVHDANILFHHRKTLTLSDVERHNLLTAGLGYMENQNVPMWYWTNGDPEEVRRLILYRALVGGDNVVASALNMAAIFGYEVLNFSMSLGHGYGIQRWFREAHANRLHRAAQTYLRKWAMEEHIPEIEAVRDNASGSQAWELDCLIIGIRIRKSLAEGVVELIQRNPESISEHVKDAFEDVVDGIDSFVLFDLIGLKSAEVRLLAIRELARRKSLTQELAIELSGDNSPEVRLEAILALANMGVPISEDRARTALTTTSFGLGSSGLFGGGKSTSDTSKFEEYQRHLLKQKSFSELMELERKDGPFSYDGLLVAFAKFPRRTASTMREMIENGFEARFDAKENAVSVWGNLLGDDFRNTTAGLRSFFCLRQTEAALNLLAARLNSGDLMLVRQVVDRWDIDASESLLMFFYRFGSWEDLGRILKLKDGSGSGLLVFSTSATLHDKLVGKALFKIGCSRISEVLEMPEAQKRRSSILAACTKKAIFELNDDTILTLLRDESELVRKVMALRCLDALPRVRLRDLLDAYALESQVRYYNVIYWLDLGIVMPGRFVRRILKHELGELFGGP